MAQIQGQALRKPHYPLLDGLRGVAALTVVVYHLFESFATSHLDQVVNHGYLAVDFFFMLSGFVLGYAYDDRWGQGMTLGGFLKRRLLRLHPMVLAATVVGAGVYFLAPADFYHASQLSWGLFALSIVMSLLMLPMLPSFEPRGFGEAFPLNGPAWSLFYEYLGSILYGLALRKLSTKALALLTAVFGLALTLFAMLGTQGDVCVGWTLTLEGFAGGLLRLLFAFPMGLLLQRIFTPSPVRGAFWIGAALIVLVCALPRLGGAEHFWLNGLYEAVCILVLFPCLILLAASGQTTDKLSTQLCHFLGELSYPLYIIHYPFLYLYLAWVKTEQLSFVQSLPGAAALYFGSIALAWLLLRYWDTPLRRKLARYVD